MSWIRLYACYIPLRRFLPKSYGKKLKGVTDDSFSDCMLKCEMNVNSIMSAHWPIHEQENDFPKKEEEMRLLQDTIKAVRNVRSKMNILEKQPLKAIVVAPLKDDINVLNVRKNFLSQMANLESIVLTDNISEKPDDAACEVVGKMQIFILLSGLLDAEAEKKKQEKKIEELEKYLKIVKNKLDNKNFVEKAPEKVIVKEREREKELLEQLSKLKKQIATAD